MRTNKPIVKAIMSNKLHIAERLREERKRIGLNQADFAAIAGSTRKTQYNYETGERSPDAGYLADIAEAGADVTYILTGVRFVQPIDRSVEICVELLNGMDKKQRELALSLIQDEERDDAAVTKKRNCG